MTDFAKNIWVGFWSAAAFFFRCMSEGFNIIADFCSAFAGKKAP